MKLSETVVSMLSPEYQERFKAEYYQLKIRYLKLKKMLQKWDVGRLGFEPTCPREIYDIQIRGMEEYLRTLVIRAQLEGIELEEINDE